MKRMLRYPVLLALAGLLSCQAKTQEQAGAARSAGESLTVSVSNPLDQPRQNVKVFVGKEKLGDDFTPASFLISGEGREVPSQYNQKDSEGIVFVIDSLPAGASETYTVRYNAAEIQPASYTRRTQAELSVKKGGKFEGRKYVGGTFENIDSLRVPDEHTDHSNYIRYEGPGWESDKVGYRFYLDWRNATDVFGKKTNDMVLQNVGQDNFDSYHEPAAWGMDVLKVGESLGIGSLGIFHEGKAVRVDETDSIIARVLENGPVYSAIQTNYYGWKVAGRSYDIQSRLSIHAGTRLTRHQVVVEGSPDNLCTGIGKDKKAELFSSPGDDTQWGFLATYGAQSLNNDKIGLAVLFAPDNFMEFTGDQHSHVVKLKPVSGELDYYFLAAWELEPNGITNKEDFLDYLKRTAVELANPVKVSVQAGQAL